MHTFRTRRRIEFSDTDMARIVHFSRFFVFMEGAEHEFWNELGLSVHTEIDGVPIGWPRLEAQCEYLRPLRFEDQVEIELRVVKRGTKSLRFEFDFTKEGELIARGRLATICCELTAEGPRAIEIPSMIAERIEEAPAES